LNKKGPTPKPNIAIPKRMDATIRKDVLGGVSPSGHLLLRSKGKDVATATASTPLSTAVEREMVEKNPNRLFNPDSVDTTRGMATIRRSRIRTFFDLIEYSSVVN
jgi:hypothetical protein